MISDRYILTGRGGVWLPVVLTIGLLHLVQSPLYAQDQADQERDPVSWSIQFEGNETYSSMVLRDIIATDRPNILQKMIGRTGAFLLRENEVRRDMIRIERYYQRRGFDRVEVDYRIEPGNRDWRRTVIFEIREGPPLRIRSVEVNFETSDRSESIIRSARAFDRALENHHYQPGRRYEMIREPDIMSVFISVMEEEGYAYAEVDVNVEIDDQARQVDVQILNRPGPRMRFAGFEIIGDLSVDHRIVERETGIRSGDTYSRSSMRIAQRELFNHHLFRFATVSIPEEPPADSTLDLTLRIREYPQRSIRTSIGFGREEFLRGEIGWQHRNVNGWAHRFGITARASFIEQRLGMDYLIPYVFNTRSRLISSPYIQRRLEPAFELFRIGFNNSLIYQYSENLTGSLSYELTYNEELSRAQDVSLPDSILSYNTGSFVLGGYYNNTIGRQGEGWQIQPTLELSSLFSEGTFGFQKVTLDVRRFTPLTDYLVIATRVQGGALRSASGEPLPSNVRFFTGGTNSVRGWGRQTLGPSVPTADSDGRFDGYVPVGGQALFAFNLEFRQALDPFINGLGVAAFLDGGQVWRSVRALDERPVQFGAGGGIRYESPIGPVRLDLGYKINPTEQDLQIFAGDDYGSRWNRFGFHFSIGQAF